jgi:hypothetical protein
MSVPRLIRQRKAEFEVVPVNHKPNGTLLRLSPQAHQKLAETIRLLFDEICGGVTLNDNRFVEEKLPTLSVVAPHPAPFGERGCSAEQTPKHRESFLNPARLIDRLPAAVVAGDKQTNSVDADLLAPNFAANSDIGRPLCVDKSATATVPYPRG